MQQYYFSLHDTTQQLFLHRGAAAETEFIWLDYTREDVRQHPEQWQQQVFQHVENLCEEQIDTLQELRDEIVENYLHLKGKKRSEKQEIMLVRVDDLSSHVAHIQKHTLRLRSAIQAAIDLHFSAIANQTNENMRILAIITAVFAPLTLLTGIYGMNFVMIPGLGSPYAFWVMLGTMLITTLLLLYYFYRRHMVGRGEKSVLDMLSQRPDRTRIDLFWFLDYVPGKPLPPEGQNALRDSQLKPK